MEVDDNGEDDDGNEEKDSMVVDEDDDEDEDNLSLSLYIGESCRCLEAPNHDRKVALGRENLPPRFDSRKFLPGLSPAGSRGLAGVISK